MSRKSCPNPLLQNILVQINNNRQYSQIYNNYNHLLNEHLRNNINFNRSFRSIKNHEIKLNQIIQSLLLRNNTQLTGKKLGEGSYGKVYNHGNKIVKNQSSNDVFQVFKECLIQETLSCDQLYGNCIPYIHQYKRSITPSLRIVMNKVNSIKYERFDHFLDRLGKSTYNNVEKIIIFSKKLIGLATVLDHFQNTYGFIHNDFKPDNFYVNKNMDPNPNNINQIDTDIQLIDYGLSGMNNSQTGFVVVQPSNIADCDMIYYSNIKLNNNNHCRSSDFLYLFSQLIQFYNQHIQNIFGTYYVDFYNTLIRKYIGSTYVSLTNIYDNLSNKGVQFVSFVLSKNTDFFYKSFKSEYLKKKRLRSLDKNINPEINDFLIQFEPNNIKTIIQNFLLNKRFITISQSINNFSVSESNFNNSNVSLNNSLRIPIRKNIKYAKNRISTRSNTNLATERRKNIRENHTQITKSKSFNKIRPIQKPYGLYQHYGLTQGQRLNLIKPRKIETQEIEAQRLAEAQKLARKQAQEAEVLRNAAAAKARREARRKAINEEALRQVYEYEAKKRARKEAEAKSKINPLMTQQVKNTLQNRKIYNGKYPRIRHNNFNIL